jgi:NADPH:quinone reductase-like Zn-dependent oxidoreductase
MLAVVLGDLGGCAFADAIHNARPITSFHRAMSPRAIAFAAFGQPARVLAVKSLPPLPSAAALGPTQAVIKFIQSPINPSDINVVQGVYPSKPSQRPEGYYVPGNEGLAEIHTLPAQSQSPLKVGDWVVMRKPQLGTWASHAVVEHGDILPLPHRAKASLSPAQAATLAVNPPTALRMLSDFVKLKPGDFFIQNAATSAVGRAAIQIAHARGVKSINFIRTRSDKT